MLFNSFQFAVFFLIVYPLYLCLNHKQQNYMLLVASYIFYGSWNAIFLTLIYVSTIVDYICAVQINDAATPRRKKFFLVFSIVSNMAILGYFKYYDFFALSFQRLMETFGIPVHPVMLNVILPVGISFYTFQSMSYVIDVYRGEIKAARNVFDFALYVAFFPQLVAGPIERSTRLLPQVLSPRKVQWPQVREGAFLIFWGLFQKVFVADNLARIADPVFAAKGPYAGVEVWMAVYAFTLQIYCDFAGYSNIARGLGKCMGFELMLNFNLPYFATNPRDLWRRWHISLSTWIRDYLFRPLGGYSRRGARTAVNVLVTFFLAGLWHGANWTFVLWGVYHGILLILYTVLEPFLKRAPQATSSSGQGLSKVLNIIFFFHLFCLGALMFRSPNVGQMGRMFHDAVFHFQFSVGNGAAMVKGFVFYVWPLLFLEIMQYRANDLDVIFRWPPVARAAFYFICFYLLFVFGVQGAKQFYYFQF